MTALANKGSIPRSDSFVLDGKKRRPHNRTKDSVLICEQQPTLVKKRKQDNYPAKFNIQNIKVIRLLEEELSQKFINISGKS